MISYIFIPQLRILCLGIVVYDNWKGQVLVEAAAEIENEELERVQIWISKATAGILKII